MQFAIYVNSEDNPYYVYRKLCIEKCTVHYLTFFLHRQLPLRRIGRRFFCYYLKIMQMFVAIFITITYNEHGENYTDIWTGFSITAVLHIYQGKRDCIINLFCRPQINKYNTVLEVVK